MRGNREDVYKAFFDLLAQTPGFASTYRRYPPLDQLKNAQKPALMMRQVHEHLTSHFAAPPKYDIAIELCIVVQTAISGGATPAEIINPLVDAIEATLTPNIVTGRLQLDNPFISRAWIEGNIEYFEAINEDLSYVTIPVQIIAV